MASRQGPSMLAGFIRKFVLSTRTRLRLHFSTHPANVANQSWNCCGDMSSVASNQLAEFAGSYLKKGRQVYLEGRLHWSTWKAADGGSRRSCEVRVGNLQVLDQRPEISEQSEEEGR